MIVFIWVCREIWEESQVLTRLRGNPYGDMRLRRIYLVSFVGSFDCTKVPCYHSGFCCYWSPHLSLPRLVCTGGLALWNLNDTFLAKNPNFGGVLFIQSKKDPLYCSGRFFLNSGADRTCWVLIFVFIFYFLLYLSIWWHEKLEGKQCSLFILWMINSFDCFQH